MFISKCFVIIKRKNFDGKIHITQKKCIQKKIGK